MIILRNRNSLDRFVADNISEYNKDGRQFSSKKLKDEIKKQLKKIEDPLFTSSDIETYLAKRLGACLSNKTEKNKLDKELDSITGSKDEIDEQIKIIANNGVYSFKDLKAYYESLIMGRLKLTLENQHDDLIKRLKMYLNKVKVNNDQFNYIKKDLNDSLKKAMYLASVNGFTRKSIIIESGTKIANEGDSAQFLFLARAILAGYNCSNVDVRSSRYDAIIDYEGQLLRVQVKGISGASIQLKDRDRGGAGIDPTARRNKGRVISSEEIDIYVAVDKQWGICYIIPATDLDKYTKKKQFTLSINSMSQYKENWSVISAVAKYK